MRDDGDGVNGVCLDYSLYTCFLGTIVLFYVDYSMVYGFCYSYRLHIRNIRLSYCCYCCRQPHLDGLCLLDAEDQHQLVV